MPHTIAPATRRPAGPFADRRISPLMGSERGGRLTGAIPALIAISGGPWMIHAPAWHSLRARLSGLTVPLAAYGGGERDDEPGDTEVDPDCEPCPPGLAIDASTGIATITVRGEIYRYADPLTSFLCMVLGGTTVDWLSESVARCAADPAIKAVLMDFDSPGGNVLGISDLFASIRTLNRSKPVLGYASGSMASAAYWFASACGRLVATRAALVGSLGVVNIFIDDAEAMKQAGLREIITTNSQSPRKYLTPDTAAGKADMQEILDGTFDLMAGDVSLGRGVTYRKVEEEFGQGGVMLAADAAAVGMIDRVGSREDALSDLLAMLPKAEPAGGPIPAPLPGYRYAASRAVASSSSPTALALALAAPIPPGSVTASVIAARSSHPL